MIGLSLLFTICGTALAEIASVVGLAAALKATVNNHPAVKGKMAELTAQGYRIDTARSGRYPSLSGQINTQDDGDEYGSLRLRQPLWAFGKIDNIRVSGAWPENFLLRVNFLRYLSPHHWMSVNNAIPKASTKRLAQVC